MISGVSLAFAWWLIRLGVALLDRRPWAARAGILTLAPTGALIVLLAHWMRDVLYGEEPMFVLGVAYVGLGAACVVASGLLLVDRIGAALRRGRVDTTEPPA